MNNMPGRRKKILYVITKSNFGGAQRYVYELATALPRDTYEVVVACGGQGQLVQKLIAAGIQVRTVASFARDIDLLQEVRALKELWRIYAEERPDIVHLNSSKAGGIGALIARLRGVPHIIFTAHGWPFYEQRHPLIQAALWLFSYITALFVHHTIVVSRHDYLYAHMPFLQDTLTQIPTGIPRIDFKDRDTARDALLPETLRAQHAHDLWAVSTGELTRNKNIRTLLEAVAETNRVSERKVFLTLIGEGEERAALQAYAASLSLSEYVYFAGYVEDVRAYLKAFDVFLLPSLKEGLPYGLLEAGAAGLGCIASNVGGIPDVIANSACGILIDPHTSTGIAHALARYAVDPELAVQHGQALCERVETQFGLTEMISKTVSLYETR